MKKARESGLFGFLLALGVYACHFVGRTAMRRLLTIDITSRTTGNILRMSGNNQLWLVMRGMQ
jgi:hypothetical protein